MTPRSIEAPAEVRPAADLGELAAQINAEHEAGEGATRKGLEHFRAAGEMLLRAKERCGHGNWLKWLENNVSFERWTANAYMRVAANWDKCVTATHLRDALRLLVQDENEPAPGNPVHTNFLRFWTEQIDGGFLRIDMPETGGGLGGLKKMLSEREKCDLEVLREIIRPRIKHYKETLARYEQEIDDALEEAND